MDHNLEDALTMDTIESMDFDHSGVVVNQEDITLEDDNMAMELDTIEEQPTLLEQGHEEVIVPDFITSGQYGFDEYTMQEDNSTGANITIAANQLNELVHQNEQTDLQLANKTSSANTSQHNIITIKAVPQNRVTKKTTSTYPREVAIAPKPTKGAPNVQYAIAPKPVTLVMNKSSVNKSALKNVQGTIKGNTVLAQIGKQLVMVPAGSGQKIRLSSLLQASSSTSNEQPIQIVSCNTDQAQLITNKATTKPLKTKFIIQGTSSAESSTTSSQPAVITKLLPVSVASTQPRYVMQQTTVPISIAGNKMVLKTPPKSATSVPKKQIISFQAQTPKVVTSQANVTKKVVITSNPSQNVIIKATGTKTVNAQPLKSTSLLQNQRTQLHPINVPGKGIQFIKLVTNQPTVQKSVTKPPPLAVSAKNFVLTDSKGNIIQMTEKVLGNQPPPLIVTSASNTSMANKLVTKTKRLVRIAPIPNKTETTVISPNRSSQSLLAPIEPTPSVTVSIEEYNRLVEHTRLHSLAAVTPQTDQQDTATVDNEAIATTADVKPTLASLISDAVGNEETLEDQVANVHEVEIEYDDTLHKNERFSEDDNTNSMEHESSADRSEENVIIVPANLADTTLQDESCQDDSYVATSENKDSTENVETDIMRLLTPRSSWNYPDTSFYESKEETPNLRQRKLCNCTKSQCLKLYCDCFTNGEFCNKCNCTNCHNNLENEELRQKAIRACLDRNPNAFRPKIGKGKTGGPEIIRRHNKGCNCKRSGCLKNYCECYEAKIACTLMCKCVGCRNVQETIERRRYAAKMRDKSDDPAYRPSLPLGAIKQPCSFMTPEVIEAVAQCMLATAAAVETAPAPAPDPLEDVLLEFSRCMADIITASHQSL